MKYYIYISDAKVDMLLPQVPHDIDKKIGMEVGFDLKLFSAKRKVESETERDRVTRLEKVVSFIEEYGNVGSMEEPAEYIADTVLMKFGPMVHGHKGGDFSGITCFIAQKGTTTLGLFGSPIHMLDEAKAGDLTLGRGGSAANHIFNYLTGMDTSQNLYHSLQYLAANMRGPEQRLEFVAKRLLQGSLDKSPPGSGKELVTIATPLYVAMAD